MTQFLESLSFIFPPAARNLLTPGVCVDTQALTIHPTSLLAQPEN